MVYSPPTTTDPVPFDQTDPAFVANPYPVFDSLRARAEIHRHPQLGVRVAVSHAACSTILRDRRLRRLWSDMQPADQFESFNVLHRNSMLSNSEPHDRLRAAFARLFTRGRVRRLHDMVHEEAARHIAELRARINDNGSACFMEHVATPLPMNVIARMVGFPHSDLPRLREWSNTIVKMYEYGISDAGRRAAEQASAAFREHVADLARFRREHPADDVLSELVAAIDRGDSALSSDELIANYILLLMAGHEATVNGLGNSVVALHTHPDQWRRLRDELTHDLDAMETAADELLRFDTPNQLFERTAVQPVEVAGERFEPGDRVAALLGAANRDPSAFARPDELDLTRTPNHHLALGAGAHYCLGAPLARLEIASTLRVLAADLPHFELAASPPRRPEFVIRGFSRLEITDRAM